MPTTLREIKKSFFPTDIYAKIVFVDNVGRQTKAGQVYTVHITDDSEIMKLSIWSDEVIKTLKIGQKINITKASASMFQNEVQLSLAKDGKIEIVTDVQTV